MAASQASEFCKNMLEQIFQVPEGASTPVGSDPHSFSGVDGSAHYRLQTRAQKRSTICPRSCGIKRQFWDLNVACLGSCLLQIRFLQCPLLSVLSLQYQVVLDKNPKFLQT